ncbi:MAG: glycosyltransferase [Mycobacteriaceae bacterium]
MNADRIRTTALASQSTVAARNQITAPTVEVVIPVFNEQRDLEKCIQRLHRYLTTQVPYCTLITIADNASTDATFGLAVRLAEEFENVQAIHLDEKGRGRALRTVWENSSAEVVVYMDVDLSTDLNALMPLIAPVISGHSDLAIGSRLKHNSRVIRGVKREFISRSYNFILRRALGASFSDAQCGFKAIRTDIAKQLLPLVQDTGWFFDTELLVLAERVGLRIHEVPVDWIDDPDSSVNVLDTAIKDLQGCWRVGRALATGTLPITALRASFGREPFVSGVPLGMIAQLMRFGIIGIASTFFYILLYLSLHPLLGAQLANFLSLLITAVGNTAANRFFTFGVQGREGAAKQQLQGLVIFGFGLLLTSGALFCLHQWTAGVTKFVELVVLVLANLVSTLTRFIALRWVFRSKIMENPYDNC